MAAPSALILTADPGRRSILVELVSTSGMRPIPCATTEEALAALQLERPAAVLCAMGKSAEDACWPLFDVLTIDSPVFSVVFSHTCASCPRLRLQAFASGARMVTEDLDGDGELSTGRWKILVDSLQKVEELDDDIEVWSFTMQKVVVA